MIRFYFCWVFLFLILSPLSAESLQDLDLALHKERLRKIFGELSLKPSASPWQASFDGKTEKGWKWADQGWVCSKTAEAHCAELNPYTFRWFITGKSFFDNWSPQERLGFEIGNPKFEKIAREGAEESAADPADDHGPGGETQKFQSKRAASEVWTWRSSGGLEAKIFVSLRNQWIEKIEYKDQTEILHWSAPKPNRTSPELTGVTVEKGDLRIVFDRQK